MTKGNDTMQMNRRNFLGTTGALIATTSMPSLGYAQGRVEDGVLKFAVDPEPSILCSLTTTATNICIVSSKIHEGLVTYDFDTNPVAELATDWEVSPDGMRFTFQLRPNVKWHDGHDFTSKDVAISIMLAKQWHSRGRTTFANVVNVETPDPLTAVIVLSKPSPFLLYALEGGETPIVAEHIYSDLPEGTNPASHPGALNPIGTGPFIFKDWVRGNSLTLERNPNYWGESEPHIDAISMRFIPDAAARAIAFETRELDLAGESAIGHAEVERMKQFDYIGLELKGYEYGGKQTQLEMNLDHPILKNLKVRQAIAHAIDRQVIIDMVWMGYAVSSHTPIGPDATRFHDATAESYPFDPEKAEALLDEAGYPRKADGMRFSLTHDYIPYNVETFKRQADYLRQALRKVGIDVTVRSQDFAAWIKRVYTDRDFDFSANFAAYSFDPSVGVQRLYWSKNFKNGVPFSNACNYSNPEVDELLEKAAIEIDQEKRIQYFKDFQQIVCREVPAINLVAPKTYTIYNTRVQDHTVTGNGIRANYAKAKIV